MTILRLAPSIKSCTKAMLVASTLLLFGCVTKRVSVTAPDPDMSKWPAYRCEIEGAAVAFKAPRFKPVERSKPASIVKRTFDFLAGPGLTPGYNRPFVYEKISARATHVRRRLPGELLPDNWTVFNYIYETDYGTGFSEYGVCLRAETCVAGDSWLKDSAKAAANLLLVNDHQNPESLRNRYTIEDIRIDCRVWTVLYVYTDDTKRWPVTISYFHPLSDNLAICFLFSYGFGGMQSVPGWLESRRAISLDVLKSVTLTPPPKPAEK